jgi:hypothetical protein
MIGVLVDEASSSGLRSVRIRMRLAMASVFLPELDRGEALALLRRRRELVGERRRLVAGELSASEVGLLRLAGDHLLATIDTELGWVDQALRVVSGRPGLKKPTATWRKSIPALRLSPLRNEERGEVVREHMRVRPASKFVWQLLAQRFLAGQLSVKNQARSFLDAGQVCVLGLQVSRRAHRTMSWDQVLQVKAANLVDDPPPHGAVPVPKAGVAANEEQVTHQRHLVAQGVVSVPVAVDHQGWDRAGELDRGLAQLAGGGRRQEGVEDESAIAEVHDRGVAHGSLARRDDRREYALCHLQQLKGALGGKHRVEDSQPRPKLRVKTSSPSTAQRATTA